MGEKKYEILWNMLKNNLAVKVLEEDVIEYQNAYAEILADMTLIEEQTKNG